MFGDSTDSNNQQQDLPAPSLPNDPTVGAQPVGAPPTQTDDALTSAPSPQVATPDDGALDTPAGAAAPAVAAPDDLLDIKQQALQQLSPLLGHLDQSPEEEFRTTMMMIQASDDQSLLQKAYDAALKIEDEKAKAQALLDIVNEINYFTQHKDEPGANPAE